MTEMTMAARLARIMGDVGRVEKKGKITSQGSGPNYKFARDADVLEAVNPKLADAGIVLVPEHTELLSLETNLRGTQIIANIKTSWHVTDGKESLRFETLGQGQDSGDKALPKAQSNARKYAFFMLFHIVTGDDPDQHGSVEQPERDSGHPTAGRRVGSSPAVTPSPAQYRREELAALMKERDLGLDEVERMASLIGIPAKTRATNEQMDALIDLVRDGLAERPESLPVSGGASEAPPPDALPPKPGSSEYTALANAQLKASARAYWAEHSEPEQASMAEALGAPATGAAA